MRTGPDRIVVCPHCEYKLRIRTLLSGNTFKDSSPFRKGYLFGHRKKSLEQPR